MAQSSAASLREIEPCSSTYRRTLSSCRADAVRPPPVSLRSPIRCPAASDNRNVCRGAAPSPRRYRVRTAFAKRPPPRRLPSGSLPRPARWSAAAHAPMRSGAAVHPGRAAGPAVLLPLPDARSRGWARTERDGRVRLATSALVPSGVKSPVLREVGRGRPVARTWTAAPPPADPASR